MVSKLLPIILVLLVACQTARSFGETGHKGTVQRTLKGDTENSEKITGQPGHTGSWGLWKWMSCVKKMHPLVIAGMQILAIIGVCVLLTDNRELELYFKVDFKVPRTDILR